MAVVYQSIIKTSKVQIVLWRRQKRHNTRDDDGENGRRKRESESPRSGHAFLVCLDPRASPPLRARILMLRLVQLVLRELRTKNLLWHTHVPVIPPHVD
jgi:hypothetical protein